MQRFLRAALFSGVLLLAAYLRLAGLTWGLNSGYGHDLNFQPDEFVSLRGTLQIDLLAGRIKAPGAYFEGTFNYYVWAIPQALLKITKHKGQELTDSTNSDLLYICRWMSVLLDLFTLVILFFAIRTATHNFYACLLGALCYAVAPIQVIYAHFMRTHTLSNFLCALVIWLSLELRKSQHWPMLLCVGFISGLGAATRYPVGLIVIIPCLYLLLKPDDRRLNWKNFIVERAKQFFTGAFWMISLGFAIGLFVGHPMLFLDTSDVRKAITGETLRYAALNEFSPSHLANMAVVWRYIDYVIPFGMYPVLWLLPYSAIVYLVFRRSLYDLSAPLLIFSFLYIYLMGKGYLGPYFARITMLLFPGFCVLVGVAFADLRLPLRHRRIVIVSLGAALILVLVPSTLFDVAYDNTMQQKDARQLAREDLQKLIGNAPSTIGVLQIPSYFYTVMPAVKPLKSDTILVRLQRPDQAADFFLVGMSRQLESWELHRIVRQVEAQGKFTYDKAYHVPMTMFGHELNLTRFPQDMTYAFPTILLFRAKTQT